MSLDINQMFQKRWFLVLLVCLCAILVTLVFWALLPSQYRVNESSDYIYLYEPVARNILDGRGITLPDSTLSTRYPPGYPIILAGIFAMARLVGISQYIVVNWFILICSGASAGLIFLLINLIFGVRFGLVASGLWITYPFALWLTKQPNSEIPFMVFSWGEFCCSGWLSNVNVSLG
jgi:hypothetical protein